MEDLPTLEQSVAEPAEVETIVDVARVCAATPLDNQLRRAELLEMIGDEVLWPVRPSGQFLHLKVRSGKRDDQLPT